MEKLFLALDKLRSSSLPVIVEGPKDRDALLSFGVQNVFVLNSSVKVVEEIASCHNICVILTDLDREGRCLYAGLSRELRSRGIRVNDSFRHFLFKTRLRNIEGLASYVSRP